MLEKSPLHTIAIAICLANDSSLNVVSRFFGVIAEETDGNRQCDESVGVTGSWIYLPCVSI